MIARVPALLALSLGLTIAPAALADVGPPDDNGCTVEDMEQEGTTCEACGSGHDSNACAEKYAGTKFKFACKTSGSSAWTEVWCDGPPDDGCALGGAPAAPPGAVAAGGLLAAVAVWMRRRPRRPA